jgi:hypothetical protein
MDITEFKDRLRKYRKEDIIFTNHAEIQAMVRQIDLEEVKENVIHPEKLVHVGRQDCENKDEEKYDCYFAYSKTMAHRYILTLNRKIIIVTIIKINRDWQKILERK